MNTEFPKKLCTRCSGSGHFSFNPKDGTICYGCSGTKFMPASRKVDALIAEWNHFVVVQKRRLAEEIIIGDSLLVNKEWHKVIAIFNTGNVNVWMGVEETPKFDLEFTLDNGETVTHSEGSLVRRKFIDTENVRQQLIDKAWSSLNKTQFAQVVNHQIAATERRE